MFGYPYFVIAPRKILYKQIKYTLLKRKQKPCLSAVNIQTIFFYILELHTEDVSNSARIPSQPTEKVVDKHLVI